jgi:hypothetical protein
MRCLVGNIFSAPSLTKISANNEADDRYIKQNPPEVEANILFEQGAQTPCVVSVMADLIRTCHMTCGSKWNTASN